MRELVTEEVVDRGRTVRLIKRLHEVTTVDGMKLAMVSKRPRRGNPRPVLLVHGLGQNRYSWHLSGRSFANYLVSRGYWTFNLELRGHGLSRTLGSRHPRNLEEYVELDVPAAVRKISEATGSDALFYIGHSLGGMIGYRLTPEVRQQLLGMVSFAGPFYFGQGNFALRQLARVGKHALNLSIVRVLPRLPFHVDAAGAAVRATLFYWDLPHNLFPVQVWHPRSIERELLRERIADGFDRTSLEILRQMTNWAAAGRFSERGDAAGDDRWLASFDTPLLCVVGDRDIAVPLGSIQPGFDRVGSRDKNLVLFGKERDGVQFGHCDLICGQHAPRLVWPEVGRWMDDRS